MFIFRLLMLSLFALSILSYSVLSCAEVLHVGIANEEKKDATDPVYYFEKLIILALEKTRATHGDYVIDYQGLTVSSDRVRALLIATPNIDIIWASVNQERKGLMRVIPIDILHGLNNYRLLLIRAEDQSVFSKISTLNQLRSFSVGGGAHWTDTEIMKQNGFDTHAVTEYSSLIKMLAADRFHFISRGLNDVFDDVERYKQYKLSIESHLLLKYERSIEYSFFVNLKNESLAQRIERGLLIAQADGSWDKLFYSMPSFKLGMDALKLKNRTELVLKNPSD